MGLYGDNGKESENYFHGLDRDCYKQYIGVIKLYRDNGKEDGNYYLGFRVRARVYRVHESSSHKEHPKLPILSQPTTGALT